MSAQPLSDERLAEIAARADRRMEKCRKRGQASLADLEFTKNEVHDLAAEIQRLSEQVARLEDDRVRYLDQQATDDAEFSQVLLERDRYRCAWQSARERAQAYGEGILRVVKDRESYQQWLKQEQAVTQQLRTELTAAVGVSESLYRRLSEEQMAGSALYAALTMPTTPEQRQAALDKFTAVAQQVFGSEAGR